MPDPLQKRRLYRADVEHERIRAGQCPMCGEPTKDKGCYVRCTNCPWCLTSGSYVQNEGWCQHFEPTDLDGTEFIPPPNTIVVEFDRDGCVGPAGDDGA